MPKRSSSSRTTSYDDEEEEEEQQDEDDPDDHDNASIDEVEMDPDARDLLETPVDEDTIRILLSTDNHVGYMEHDPVRGLDSFAALEEVLWLVFWKRHSVVVAIVYIQGRGETESCWRLCLSCITASQVKRIPIEPTQLSQGHVFACPSATTSITTHNRRQR